MSDDTLLADDTTTATDDTTVTTTADTTVADTATTDTTTADDWRARLAGDDDKLKGYLARVPSEKALVEQLKKHNDDMKAGKYLKPLPENPTDAELADWRKANAVPETPDGYMQALPDGLVVGDDDKPYVEQFLAEMHKVNARPQDVNGALAAYYNIVEEQQAAQLQAAAEAKDASTEDMREEWGPEFKRNLNVVKAHLDSLPEGVAAVFKEGLGPDGLPLANNADLLRWLAAQAMEANPLSTVVPGAGANQASAIADEMGLLEKKMGDRGSDYWKGPLAAKQQARYLELVTAKEKMAARGG